MAQSENNREQLNTLNSRQMFFERNLISPEQLRFKWPNSF